MILEHVGKIQVTEAAEIMGFHQCFKNGLRQTDFRLAQQYL